MGHVHHGSATTTEATHRAIQNSQESLRALAKRYGINQKTVAKWKKRTSVADLPTGPKDPHSSVLSLEEEAIIVAFRKHTLLPLDDCLNALQAARHFRVSPRFVNELMKLRRETGSLAPRRQGHAPGWGKLAPHAAFVRERMAATSEISSSPGWTPWSALKELFFTSHATAASMTIRTAIWTAIHQAGVSR